MAIAALSFGTPSPIPTAPNTGKKLFLGADGAFFTVNSDGVAEPLRTQPLSHYHDISDVNGLEDDLVQSRTIYSDTPPEPTESLRWVDTQNLRAYEYLSGAWVEVDC